MLVRLLLYVTAACLFGDTALCEDGRAVSIKVEKKTPACDVVTYIERPGEPIKLPIPDPNSPSVFEYKFKVSDDEWFNHVHIKLHWKGDQQSKADCPSDEFDQRIVLRIRHDFPPKFYFPIFFSNDRTKTEMTRLEGMKDPYDQFEVFFALGKLHNIIVII